MKIIGTSRHDVIKLLGDRKNLIGIELGVASGSFSRKMVECNVFSSFWGVDMYADTHDTKQYLEAISIVGLDSPYKLVRATFDEALTLFPDQYFDFLYLDGYAGAGLEGGKTLDDWAKKVKVNGVIAGDDYHEDFKDLMLVVDDFIKRNDFELFLTGASYDYSPYSHYPSWATIKSKESKGSTPSDLKSRIDTEASRLKRKKLYSHKFNKIARKVFSEEIYEKLRLWNKKRKEKRRRNRVKDE